MRLVFAGTPDFAVPALDALVTAGHDIAAVYSQPDRPAGRGRAVKASAVTARARALKLPVRQPERFDADSINELAALAPEAIVVVAYGLILPKAVLAVAKHCCFNIHASLLPRWRGAAPIQRAVLAGDAQTGITIMRMDEGLDTGPMVLRKAVPIETHATSGELQDQLAPLGAQLMVEALAALAAGTLRETAQPATGVTYARKISKEEARLDWRLPSGELARRVRGYHPSPVAWTELDGERIRIHRARGENAGPAGTPGTVIAAGEDGIRVATGSGVLRIAELQWPGGKPLSALQACAGHPLTGKRFV